MLTLTLYSALRMLQLRMEGSRSCGMVMTLVTFSLAEGGMGSPTSFRRSLVSSRLFPRAKKLCLRYKQYLGLIGRDELFWMQATTIIPSPAKHTSHVETSLVMRVMSVSISWRALTLAETCFFKIHIHGYHSWVEKFHFLVLSLVLRFLKELKVLKKGSFNCQHRHTHLFFPYWKVRYEDAYQHIPSAEGRCSCRRLTQTWSSLCPSCQSSVIGSAWLPASTQFYQQSPWRRKAFP